MMTKPKGHLKLRYGNITRSWSILTLDHPICRMLSLFGVKNILAKKKLKIDSQISLRQLRLWLALHNVMVVSISFQKTITWQEMISWSCHMYGTNGSVKRNDSIVAHAINSLILLETMDIWNSCYTQFPIWKRLQLTPLVGNLPSF